MCYGAEFPLSSPPTIQILGLRQINSDISNTRSQSSHLMVHFIIKRLDFPSSTLPTRARIFCRSRFYIESFKIICFHLCYIPRSTSISGKLLKIEENQIFYLVMLVGCLDRENGKHEINVKI